MSNNGPGIHVDPHLFDARENSPSSMRAIANELRSSLNGMLGDGRRPNSDEITGCGLSGSQIGQWDDAVRFSSQVGSSNAGRKFAEVYGRFVQAYQEVCEAIEASADNLDRARRANEGDG
ncbi:hypothetical protein [Nonomuraea jiangxiensis]|uniref:Excreted virulence factor EspC, type VII ESX diderm n=1 Tax=Nonomuraea jiangxiensis TaxID=633440 RepID=A0A1G8FJ42_9ACTN|nr:hypothetical protein [Nonomuraea jiangxiensis]SDH82056.1 hypothetical protein SAMN05421869_103332 [Nonomuraea jiangxiensis]